MLLEMLRVEIVGVRVVSAPVAIVFETALISCSISIDTSPLVLMRGVTFKITPVFLN
jgi:hypothetical protein